MGILLSILLIALGLLGAEAFVSEKLPASKSYFAKTVQYREFIGLAGLVLGVVGLIEWITIIPMLRAGLLSVLLSIVATLLLLGLGLIFSLDFIRSNLKNPTAPFLVKIDRFRSQILPFQQILGIAAIVVGFLNLLYNL